jgi:enoyl-CoA hydratase/isomerase-like protein
MNALRPKPSALFRDLHRLPGISQRLHRAGLLRELQEDECIYRAGKKVLLNLIDIPVPVNGPTTVHSEYVLLADIVIATSDTVFQDKPHVAFGIVPGAGIHSLWPEVIGSIRGRTFVLTQQIIDAQEAKTLGVISEILPREHLLHRAREIAHRIAKLPALTASYTRVALTQKLRRVIDESVGYLALEGIFRRRRRALSVEGLDRRVEDVTRTALGADIARFRRIRLEHAPQPHDLRVDRFDVYVVAVKPRPLEQLMA